MNSIQGNHKDASPMNVILVPVAWLKPAKMQPESRTRDPRVERMAIELKDLDQLQPVLIDRVPSENDYAEILIGHTRWQGAIRAGWSKINAVVKAGLNWHQKREIFRREAQIVEKPGSWQWFEAYFALGQKIKDIPRRHARDIVAMQEILGTKDLTLLFEQRFAPCGQKIIFRLYAALAGELKASGGDCPSLKAVGEWVINEDQSHEMKRRLEKRLGTSTASKIASAIRRGKALDV